MLFETTHEKRFQLLEHLKTVNDDSDEWKGNLWAMELHYEFLSTNGANINACDLYLHQFYKRKEEEMEVADFDEFSHLEWRARCLGRDVMKHYLMENKIIQAQLLVDLFEYV